MDVHTPEQRSFNMSRIQGKNTHPEMIVRHWLWANGYRYRLHRKDLPGKPDIVLPKYHAVIFVHGCFWHRHGCKATTIPANNTESWCKKFNENVARDIVHIEALQNSGWRVAVIWECTIKANRGISDRFAEGIHNWLN